MKFKVRRFVAVFFLWLALPASAGNALAFPETGCLAVEPFRLNQKRLRRLRAREFHGDVFVYVGDVHRSWAPVYVLIGKPQDWPETPDEKLDESDFEERLNGVPAGRKWRFEAKDPGDQLAFRYGQKEYQFELVRRVWKFIGTDWIAGKICQPRQQ